MDQTMVNRAKYADMVRPFVEQLWGAGVYSFVVVLEPTDDKSRMLAYVHTNLDAENMQNINNSLAEWMQNGIDPQQAK